MIKKSILIESRSSITTKNRQLVIESEIRQSTIPVEDIGILVLDHPEIYLSLPAASSMEKTVKLTTQFQFKLTTCFG